MKNSVCIVCCALWSLTLLAQVPKELQRVLPADNKRGDQFGSSVAISGEFAIVNARLDDSPYDDSLGIARGSAYILRFNGSKWVEHSKLTASEGVAWDSFGVAVAIDGNYALVGTRCAAYVFHYDGTSWIEQDKLVLSEEYAGCGLLNPVSLSGNYAIIGVPGDNEHGTGTGAAYIFVRNGRVWSLQAKLTAANVSGFGRSVSISGKHVLVGLDNDLSMYGGAGAAYMFVRKDSTWTLQDKLTSLEHDESRTNDEFGSAVSVNGNYAIVGAFWDTNDTNPYAYRNPGSAYIFVRYGDKWVKQTRLIAPDQEESRWFGRQVSISEQYAIISAQHYRDGPVHVFAREGSAWQHFTTINNVGGFNAFGLSTGISGEHVAIGAPYEGDGNGFETGAAYFYRLPPRPPSSDCAVVKHDLALASTKLVCDSDTYTLDASIENAQYLWNTGQTTQQITVDKSGTYWVRVNKDQCLATDTVDVDFLRVDLGSDTIFCETIDYTLKTGDLDADFRWSTGETTSEIRVTQPGTYWVEATKGNCTVVDSIRLNVIETPRETLDTLLCQGETFTWDVYQPGSAYYWEDGSNAAAKELTEAGTYTVHVENQCFAMQRTLRLKTENCACEVFVPNIFTPNNDGSNDFFQPVIHQRIQNSVLRIYDRRGKLLHEENKLGRWNGILREKAAPAGSYYWTFDYICIQDNAPVWQHQKGWVTLLRDHSRTH